MDLQLRGRAGRQGDPGESRFFVSLEDDLLVRYGIDGRDSGAIRSRTIRRRPSRARSSRARSPARSASSRGRTSRSGGRSRAMPPSSSSSTISSSSGGSAILTGEEPPGHLATTTPEHRAALVAAVGEHAVVDAERTVMLACIDRAWRDHLALCADLREGIHLVRLGGQDPLTAFTSEAIQAFSTIDEAIDEAVLAALAKVRSLTVAWISRRRASRRRHRRGPISSTTTRSRAASARCSPVREGDARHLLGGDADAVADAVGCRREAAAAGRTAALRSLWQIGTSR